jgi:hypothetical protein
MEVAEAATILFDEEVSDASRQRILLAIQAKNPPDVIIGCVYMMGRSAVLNLTHRGKLTLKGRAKWPLIQAIVGRRADA